MYMLFQLAGLTEGGIFMIWQKKKSDKADKKIKELQENIAATDEAVNDVLMGDIAEQVAAMQEALNAVLMKGE